MKEKMPNESLVASVSLPMALRSYKPRLTFSSVSFLLNHLELGWQVSTKALRWASYNNDR